MKPRNEVPTQALPASLHICPRLCPYPSPPLFRIYFFQVLMFSSCGFFLHLLCFCLFLHQGSPLSEIFLWRALSLSKAFQAFTKQWGHYFSLRCFLKMRVPKAYPGHLCLGLHSSVTKGSPFLMQKSENVRINSFFRGAEIEVQKLSRTLLGVSQLACEEPGLGSRSPHTPLVFLSCYYAILRAHRYMSQYQQTFKTTGRDI